MRFLLSLVLLISSNVFAANIVDNPGSTQTIAPTAAGVKALVVDNTGTASSGEIAIQGKSTDYDGVQGLSHTGFGGYFHSDSGYGLMGDSINETSGYFASAYSGNTKPTLLIQSITGNANLFEIQDLNGVAYLYVDSVGQLVAKQGVMVATAGTKPTCNSAHRGELWVVQGATGVADLLQACLKDAANAYSWVTK